MRTRCPLFTQVWCGSVPGVAVAVGTDVLVDVGRGVFVAVPVAVAVFVGVAVRVAVGVGVFVAVGTAVGVLVGVAVLVAVAVDVFVGVGVAVFVAVAVGVFVAVDVGVFVAVAVSVGVSVAVDVAVAVFVAVDVGVGVSVAVDVAVAVLVAVAVGIGVSVGNGVSVGVDVSVAVGVGVVLASHGIVIMFEALPAVTVTSTDCDPAAGTTALLAEPPEVVADEGVALPDDALKLTVVPSSTGVPSVSETKAVTVVPCTPSQVMLAGSALRSIDTGGPTTVMDVTFDSVPGIAGISPGMSVATANVKPGASPQTPADAPTVTPSDCFIVVSDCDAASVPLIAPAAFAIAMTLASLALIVGR